MLAIEREVLRAICQLLCSGAGPLPQEQVQRLEQYRFDNPTHQLIFDTLVELRKSFAGRGAPEREALREHLARLLTRKGFPDVDLAPFLRPTSINIDEIQKLARRLTNPPGNVSKSNER